MVANKQIDNALEKRNAEAKVAEMGKGKQKSTCANKGKENAPVDLHHHRNGVVIRDEMHIRICEDKRRAEAIAVEKLKGTSMGKGKKKVTYANKGQDNSVMRCMAHGGCATEERVGYDFVVEGKAEGIITEKEHGSKLILSIEQSSHTNLQHMFVWLQCDRCVMHSLRMPNECLRLIEAGS